MNHQHVQLGYLLIKVIAWSDRFEREIEESGDDIVCYILHYLGIAGSKGAGGDRYVQREYVCCVVLGTEWADGLIPCSSHFTEKPNLVMPLVHIQGSS